MLPKYTADYRTIFTVLCAPALVAFLYARPDMIPYLWVFSLYFALACGIIAHNHNHVPTFPNRNMSSLFGNVLSVFYGYPVFAWIPTHNLNHHRYVNTAGDATITWRYTNRHNFFVAATYFFVSAYFQAEPTKEFIKKAKERRSTSPMYSRIVRQYLFWAGSHVVMLALALGLHGFKTGLYVYAFTLLIPAVFTLWTIMLFNYDQHVHTDPWTQNHSRSFVGKLLNFLLFNNGLHAAHHEDAGVHWSKLPEVHARIAPNIDKSLLQRSLWWYWFKQYALAPFFPKLGTVQLGRGPMNPPNGERSIECADVELGEAGTNAVPIQAVGAS